MTEDNMRMASFRIDRDLWAKFSAIAKRERYTVTEALTDYIQLCTDNDKLELSVNTGNDAVANNQVMTNNYNADIIMTKINTAIEESLPIHIANYLLTQPVGFTYQEVRDIAAATIKDSIAFERLCDEAAVIKVGEKLVNAAFKPLNESLAKLEVTGIREKVEPLIKAEIAPLNDSVAEVKEYAQNQIKQVREELKKSLALAIASPTENHSATTKSVAIPVKATDRDSVVKSWAEFFKMIGMDALTSAEAQKKEKIDIRTSQVAQGLEAAREKGLGEWAVKVAGRSFVRVGD